MRLRPIAVLASCCLLFSAVSALALTPRRDPLRFDALARPETGAVIGVAPVLAGGLPAGDSLREDWERFAADRGGEWRAYVDDRNGLPTLAFGRGISWVPAGQEARITLEQLEALARAFMEENTHLLGRYDARDVRLDPAASGPAGDLVWHVTFRQTAGGVPVRGARYDFQVSSGNLVAFGATRWAPVRIPTTPALGIAAARAALDTYLGLTHSGEVVDREPGRLELAPVDPAQDRGAAWKGARGEGYAHRLVWRFVFEVPGESATWVADVDAQDGTVLSLFDDTRYARVKGAVYPLTNDGIGPEGTAQPGYPMPFADVGSGSANDAGVFSCSGGNQTTALAGPYVRVSDKCGAITESATCPADIDLGTSGGTDCTVPPGDSAGNTHAARSSFYHLNRVMEKGRTFLPDNSWLKAQLVDNVNITQTCNAYWNGSVNFFRSGGGCRNTGELQGVFVHEWGHGIDANDGGGYDNPSEAYADAVAILESRESCVGRGFFVNGNCGGYGDTCLSCTGIRDQDWDKRVRHTPATPTNFAQTSCGGGGGPCGREEHCEAYVSAEAVWDLATRDLPAMGVDEASAWQLTEKLWYQSRSGSGGNAYNCALPSSDGCGTNTWFHKFRLQDDNDGNLSNGTPHAAAIFAAFARHGIACGAAEDVSNRNSAGCAPMVKPTLTADPSGTQVRLTWSTVPGSSRYLILRNDIGCERGQVIVDRVNSPATTYTDTAVGAGFTVYYRVQAQASSAACESPVSDCVAAATPAPAGTVGFDRDAYACSATVRLRVLDGNVGGSTVTARVSSPTESQPETVTLTEGTAGGGNFAGTILVTTGPAAHGDGRISVTSGDQLTVEYTDADDGVGGTNVIRRDTAAADCFAPVIANVEAVEITDSSAALVWTTDEVSDATAAWGLSRPPQSSTPGTAGTQHRVALSGLAPCSLYFFDVRSTDAAGNTAVADNGGGSFYFQTFGDFGSGPEVCRLGAVSIDQAVPRCGTTLTFGVSDVDLDANPAVAETATVFVSSTTENEPEAVTVTETSLDSLRFTGAIELAGGAPVRDGRLQVKHGDVVTVSYLDASDGHGGSGWRAATVTADCRGPGIANVAVTALTNARATIRFTTDEPGDALVEWGTTPALGQSSSSPDMGTVHELPINQFDTC